jgi:hypothetical protein
VLPVLTFTFVRTGPRGKPNQLNSLLPPCEMVERGSKASYKKGVKRLSPVLCPHMGEIYIYIIYIIYYLYDILHILYLYLYYIYIIKPMYKNKPKVCFVSGRFVPTDVLYSDILSGH